MTFNIGSYVGPHGREEAWRALPGKTFLREVDSRSTTGSEDLLGLSASRGVMRKQDMEQRTAQAESYIGYKQVRVGDLVCNKMQARNGLFGISPHEGIISPDYAIFEFTGSHNPEFIEYAVRTGLYSAEFLSRSTGIGTGFMRLNPDEFLSVRFWLPDREVQDAIVQFLDAATDHIDELVLKKRRFVELSRERFVSSVIHATAPRESWGAAPFWSLAHFKSVSGRADEDLLSVYLDRGVIPYSEGGGLVHKPAESLDKYQLVEPGDFVMNNQQAWRGSVGVSSHRGIVSPAYLVLGLDLAKIDPAFANYAFRSKPYVDQFMLASMSVGDIQRQIKWHLLRRVFVSLPPLEEQRTIAARLDREKARIDLLIAKTERSIELLKEHRSALITAAVTGKINVRGLAAKNMKAAA